jgi:hypothetical protein
MGEIRTVRRLLLRHHGAATNRLIESGSQIVQSICRGQPQIAGHWLRNPDSEPVPSLRISLGPKSYDVGVREGFEGGAIITDVMFGTFNL